MMFFCPLVTCNIVFVGMSEKDRQDLNSIFNGKRNYNLIFVPDYATVSSIDYARISVAVVRIKLKGGGLWSDNLDMFLNKKTKVIIADRLVDEALWIEALNLGVHDVIRRPFAKSEVLHSVSIALFHWLQENKD